MSRPRILINVFHPDLERSRGHRALMAAVASLDDATVRDLYAEYPDFGIDVAREQDLLRGHDVVVMQHPLYWYSAPALLKEWEDRVLEHGFAYPPGVGDALKGKSWLTVTTTGGAAEAYRSGGANNWTMSELLRPFQQTAYLCGMTWLPPFVVHGVLPARRGGGKLDDAQLAARGTELRDLLASLTA